MNCFRLPRLTGVVFISILLLGALPALALESSSDARAELIGSWQKMTAQRDLAFRVTSTIDMGKRAPMKSLTKVRWPNRFHMKNDQSEMVILPAGTWMKLDGNWMKMPIDMQKAVAQFTPEVTRQSMEMMQNVRFVGLDNVGVQPVKVYTYDFDGKIMGIRSSGTSKVFLSVASGYPLRIETTGKAMGKTSTTINEYEYDDSIRIESP
jgi:hypothetical protein